MDRSITGLYVTTPRRGLVLDWQDEIWQLDDDQAYQINNPYNQPIARNPDLNMLQTLQALFQGLDFHKLTLGPGEYYPRIARPGSTQSLNTLGKVPDFTNEYLFSRVRSSGQLHAFIQTLQDICGILQPEGQNLASYGHEIRNVLVLACTEVEAHCKNILRDNKYLGRSDRSKYNNLSTKDYVRLRNPMKLDDYLVRVNFFPWMDELSPFRDWDIEQPSKSLDWYRAYNDVKHDREFHFREATLLRAFHAVSACFVMLCAQYGDEFALRGAEADRAFFQVLVTPEWAPSDIYIPPRPGDDHEPQKYPFERQKRPGVGLSPRRS